MELILKKERLTAFLSGLKKGYEIYAPKEREGVTMFKEFKEIEGQLPDLSRLSTKPPKEILFPQTETMFKFTKEKIETPSEDKRKIIFGIRPCDARGFVILDPLFGGEYDDVYYQNQREKTILVGIACNQPAVNCFCTSLGGGPASKEGLDLLFTDIGEQYFVEVITDKGERLIDKNLFEDATSTDRKKCEEIQKSAEKKIRRHVNIEKIGERLEGIFEDPRWKNISLRCLRCGTCTYLCPTCHCFDIQDEVLRGEGKRVRIWDSCMFPEYTLEASGYNPRPTRESRIRNRVYHKYKWYQENFGFIACVGCGRCVDKCPVNIDIIDIISGV
jgi:ferredoxin